MLRIESKRFPTRPHVIPYRQYAQLRTNKTVICKEVDLSVPKKKATDKE
jgi:hypothetical protein